MSNFKVATSNFKLRAATWTVAVLCALAFRRQRVGA
jgi:hypothetical protein